MNKLTLTADTEITLDGYKLFVRDTFAWHAVGARESLEQAVEEILQLKRDLADMKTQATFWKQACEQALDGWNKLEDEHEELLECLAEKEDK